MPSEQVAVPAGAVEELEARSPEQSARDASAPAMPRLGIISKRTESRVSKRYSHTHVHSSIIHSSQKVEATQVSIDR